MLSHSPTFLLSKTKCRNSLLFLPPSSSRITSRLISTRPREEAKPATTLTRLSPPTRSLYSPTNAHLKPPFSSRNTSSSLSKVRNPRAVSCTASGVKAREKRPLFRERSLVFFRRSSLRRSFDTLSRRFPRPALKTGSNVPNSPLLIKRRECLTGERLDRARLTLLALQTLRFSARTLAEYPPGRHLSLQVSVSPRTHSSLTMTMMTRGLFFFLSSLVAGVPSSSPPPKASSERHQTTTTTQHFG
mmetsp:Transcript_371/g.1233  ORF Transcript_371/g.1233 Transcript_371/m.1233 type:complete len:245 (+) Transcript_371:2844-3578(+)